MKKSDYGFLFLVAIVFYSLIATLQKVPGYMDAEYYFGQSIRLVQHHDLVEPFIWNYLNNPSSVSVPGFAFWLPATSFIAAGGLLISGGTSFFSAKILFILMASCITLMAAFIGNQFLPGRRAGWLAGLLSMFSGFFLPFITIIDTFTPYMFFGGLIFICFWFADKKKKESSRFNYWFLIIGILTGLMSLTRSDGLLWLAGGWLGVLMICGIKNKQWKKSVGYLVFVAFGFALIMIPWYLRNYSIYGTIFPSGNGLMLWLTKYDNLFVYPSKVLAFSYWSANGFGIIVLDRLKALGLSLQTLIASGGAIVLAPIMAIAAWKQRKTKLVKLAMVMLISILTVMTVVFPYAGERGGFFHSLSAVQVVLWGLVPLGLDAIIQWGVSHRHWKTKRSWKMFGTALVVAAALFSAVIFAEKLTSGTESGIPWNQTQDSFTAIEQGIMDKTVDRTGVIMLNDPPGYTLVTNRPSIMIPTGGVEALIEVSKRYQVHYLAVNDERTDLRSQLDKNEMLKEHFQLVFETAGNSVYEFKP